MMVINNEQGKMDLKEMMEEYQPDKDIFSKDSELVRKSKLALSRQPVSDQIIMVLYAEAASMRDVAKVLGISTSLAFKEIKRIQGNIMTAMGI